jgi:hypothetical protein
MLTKLKRIRWAGNMALMGKKNSTWVGKHYGKRSCGRHGSRWKNNIKVYLTERRY